MTRICIIDVETTSLRPDRRAWEIGVIVRDPGVEDVEHHWFVNYEDLDLGNADLGSLKIGRFHDRHPQMRTDREPSWTDTKSEEDTLDEIEPLLRGAIIVGVNPAFDCETLAARMRENGICPAWSYRLVDARTLAAGALRMRPPWDVDAILESFGVFCPPEDRHTAMGDARLARDLYDAVFAERSCGRPHIAVPSRTDEQLVEGITQAERDLLSGRDSATLAAAGCDPV